MNLTIVSPVFPPEPVVSAQTSYQVAVEALQRGNQVKVITAFPNRPQGKLYSGYRRGLYKREKFTDSFQVVRCFSFISGESSMLSRLLENLSFGVTSSIRILFDERVDVIYSNSWPILATGMLVLAASIKRIPVIVTVQDIYPESLLAQQRVPENSLLIRLMRWIDLLIARQCKHLIVISDLFAELYLKQRRVQPDKISVIPNWIDEGSIDIGVSRDKFRTSKGIDQNGFLLVYGGNIGMAAGVEILIKAMRSLADLKSVKLLVAGAGSQLANCQALVHNLQESNVFFHSPWKIEETSEVLRSGDILALPTSSQQSFASVPSKLISYMLAGRPLLCAVQEASDSAQIVRKAGCGWVVKPDDPAAIAEEMRRIVNIDPDVLRKMGAAGREYALAHFTKRTCLPKVMKLIEEAAGHRKLR